VNREWCTLPIEALRSKQPWVVRALYSLVLVWARPARYLREVPTNLSLAPYVGLGLLVRAPFWLVSVVIALDHRRRHGIRVPFDEPYLVDATLGSALADVLAFWLHLMVPLGVPILLGIVGFAAHVPIWLTASSQQTFVSTARVAAFASAGLAVVAGATEVLLQVNVISLEVRAAALAAGIALCGIFMAIGLARTHRVSWLAGAGLALFPTVVLALLTSLRPLLTLPVHPL
jgi:hypothetical protein